LECGNYKYNKIDSLSKDPSRQYSSHPIQKSEEGEKEGEDENCPRLLLIYNSLRQGSYTTFITNTLITAQQQQKAEIL